MPAGAQSELPALTTGAAGFFIGHSFFVPTSSEFDALVDKERFPNHSHSSFFRGGPNGSPQALWVSHRCEIEAVLAEGNVELFGMTIHDGTTVEDYAKWIDLALSYNIDTKFFIGIPWAPDGAITEDAAYEDATDLLNRRASQGISTLRSMYPYSPIYLLHYGVTAVKMRELYREGNLVGINNLLGHPSDSIYRDESPGHEGTMMRDVNALLWYSLLYGVDPSPFLIPSYDASNVNDIISYAMMENAGMNDQVVVERPSNFQPNAIASGCGGDEGDSPSVGSDILSFMWNLLSICLG